jgi:hypothetical protein
MKPIFTIVNNQGEVVTMHIALIGGVERNENALAKLARDRGHTLDFHGGHTRGRGIDELHRVVERADLVLITTDVNSHNAVQVARKLARKQGIECVMMRSCNPTRFRELLETLPVALPRAA